MESSLGQYDPDASEGHQRGFKPGLLLGSGDESGKEAHGNGQNPTPTGITGYFE